MEQDIRWQQRYANFRKALSKLSEIVESREISNLSELEKEGLIQRFEYTYELAWKTLQDLLKYNGYSGMMGPNPILAQALKDGYITNHDGWRNLKEARNVLSHVYSEGEASNIIQDIYDQYHTLFCDLNLVLQNIQYNEIRS